MARCRARPTQVRQIAGFRRAHRRPAGDYSIVGLTTVANAFATRFPLRTNSSSRPFGRLIVRFTSGDEEQHSADLKKVRAIINCISRQLAITTDLSSTQPAAGRNRADMLFLTGLDKLILGQDANAALTVMLDELARHLDCTMVAVLAPQSKTKRFWPQEAPENGSEKDPLSVQPAVVGIARVKGAATIAEYVEDAAIAARLRELGVDFGQGFGIGRPEPLADVLGRMVSPLDVGLTSTMKVPNPDVMKKLA